MIYKVIALITSLGLIGLSFSEQTHGTIAESFVDTGTVAPGSGDKSPVVGLNAEELKNSAKDTTEESQESTAAEASIDTMAATIESADTVDTSSVGIGKDTLELTDDEIILVGDEEGEIEDTLPPIEKMPELKEFVEADYPAEIYKQGIEGTVLMELLVSDSGIVESVSVVKGIHPVLDSSAAGAALKFVFIPAEAGGEKVPVLIQYEYRFELKEIVKKIEEYVNFSGILIERGTKKPIADAMIVLNFIDTLSDTTLPVPFSTYLKRLGKIKDQYLEEDRLVTITDSLGHFSFYSLPSCTVEVTAPLPGYEEFREREFITPKEETIVKYYIRRISYSQYEIVVYGKVEEKEVSRRQLTITEVKKIPGLGGDAVKVVQALPGVARPMFGSGQIVVRGAPTWDSQFYIDGVTIPQLYHFGGIKSVYNSDALESVDFYPGGFGTRYGSGIAGVIEITGRQAKKDRWHGNVDLSNIDGSFLVEGPINSKVSILASARRSFIGDILSWYVKNSDRDFPFTITPFYWDYLLRGDYDVDEKNHIFLTAFGSRDSFALIFPSMPGGSEEVDEATDRMGMKLSFYMGILGWDWKLRDNLENQLRYSFTYMKSHTSIFGWVVVDFEEYDNYLRDQLTYTISDRLKCNLGLDFAFYNLGMMLVIPAANNAIFRDTTTNWLFGDIGAYVNFEWKPHEKILIIPGFRYDYFPELMYDGSIIPEYWDYKNIDNEKGISGEPSLRLTTRYEFVKNHTAKFSIGNYSQTPQPIGQAIHETWGDPSLPATKAAHYVLGYEWRITDLINTDIQFYLNRQWDIPRIAMSEDLDPSAGGSQLWLDDGRGRMRGIEIMLRHDQGERFFGWLAYTLSRTERYNHTTGEYELYGEDETHHIQLIGSWHLRRDWDLGFRMRYVTGKPKTPIIGVEEDEQGNYYFPIYGEKNSERVGPFYQLDFRVDKKFVFDKWMFSLYLDLQNLSYFVYKSPELEIHNFNYTDKTTVSNIFMPAIGYKAEF